MVMVFKWLVSPEANVDVLINFLEILVFFKSEKKSFATFACLICLFVNLRLCHFASMPLPLCLHVTASLRSCHCVQDFINILKQFPSQSILVKINNVEEFLISRNHNLCWKTRHWSLLWCDKFCTKFDLKRFFMMRSKKKFQQDLHYRSNCC